MFGAYIAAWCRMNVRIPPWFKTEDASTARDNIAKAPGRVTLLVRKSCWNWITSSWIMLRMKSGVKSLLGVLAATTAQG